MQQQARPLASGAEVRVAARQSVLLTKRPPWQQTTTRIAPIRASIICDARKCVRQLHDPDRAVRWLAGRLPHQGSRHPGSQRVGGLARSAERSGQGDCSGAAGTVRPGHSIAGPSYSTAAGTNKEHSAFGFRQTPLRRRRVSGVPVGVEDVGGTYISVAHTSLSGTWRLRSGMPAL